MTAVGLLHDWGFVGIVVTDRDLGDSMVMIVGVISRRERGRGGGGGNEYLVDGNIEGG